MIIELYGCPGCGKTYLINQVTGQTETVAMSKNWIKNILLYIAKRISLLTPESIKLKKKILKCVKQENEKFLYVDRSVKYFINNIVMLVFGYRHINKNIYMAEGIVHRVISMAVNFGWETDVIDSIMESLSDIMNKVTPFYLEVNVNTCFESIKKRNRHENQMDELDDQKLLKFLKAYYDDFEYITEKYGFIRICRDDYKMLKEIIK